MSFLQYPYCHPNMRYTRPIALIAFFFVCLSCGSGRENVDPQTYQHYKKTLAEEEKENPLSFLSVTGDNKKNLVGQTVIHGKILNRGTIVSYKDVRIKMLCYKNEKLVEEHEDVVHDIIKPNSTINFKTRYRLPKGTDSVALSVMHAAIAE